MHTHTHTQDGEQHAAELVRQEEAAAAREAALIEQAKWVR
jgi:hypothetical protein